MDGILLFLAALALVLLLIMGVFGEWGLVDLLKLRREKAVIDAVNTEIASENKRLSRRIYRLKNDRQYIENIIRRELGVVKDDELIIETKAGGPKKVRASKPEKQ